MAATVTMLANLHRASPHIDMHSTLRITGEHRPLKMESDSDTLDNDRIDYNDVFMVSESLAAAAAAAASTTSVTAPTTSTSSAPPTMTNAAPVHHQPPPSKSGGVKRSRSSSSSGGETPELFRCKRRINFAQLGYGLPPAAPTSVARRNERERNRVKLVNLGFATLREHVPNGAKNKKMSKVETLRSAVEYIRKLQELLIMDGATGADIENALLDFGSSFDVDSSVDSPGSSSEGGSSSQTENIAPSHHHHHHSHINQHQVHHHNLLEEQVTSPESAPSPHAVHNHHSHHLVLQQQQQALPQPHQRYPSAIRSGHSTTTVTSGAVTTSTGHLVSTHPPSSVSPACSVASSPTPSYTSDYSSYEPLSPEDEDLLDFTSWFS